MKALFFAAVAVVAFSTMAFATGHKSTQAVDQEPDTVQVSQPDTVQAL